MCHNFFSMIVRGPERLLKIKQFGVLSPMLCSLAGAPAREPITKGNADAGEENFPGVEEPLKEVPYQFNRGSISAVPRSSPQVLKNWGNGMTTQLVLTRENAKVGTVRVCSVHGGNVMASSGEPGQV